MYLSRRELTVRALMLHLGAPTEQVVKEPAFPPFNVKVNAYSYSKEKGIKGKRGNKIKSVRKRRG